MLPRYVRFARRGYSNWHSMKCQLARAAGWPPALPGQERLDDPGIVVRLLEVGAVGAALEHVHARVRDAAGDRLRARRRDLVVPAARHERGHVDAAEVGGAVPLAQAPD